MCADLLKQERHSDLINVTQIIIMNCMLCIAFWKNLTGGVIFTHSAAGPPPGWSTEFLRADTSGDGWHAAEDPVTVRSYKRRWGVCRRR